jgi:hypothetical protein
MNSTTENIVNTGSHIRIKNGLRLKNGVLTKVEKERGCYNKSSLAIKQIGIENVESLISMQLSYANEGLPHERMASQHYLLNKVLPQARPETFIQMALIEMGNIADILENENRILQSATKGEISVEAAEKLFNMTGQVRGTLEIKEVAALMKQIEEQVDSKIEEYINKPYIAKVNGSGAATAY